jgi:hypothetical protein
MQEVRANDFFGSPARKEAEAMMRALDRRLVPSAGRPAGRVRRSQTDLVGRAWVTRKDPRVDRLASAWLIRRFVDPGARFRFIDPQRETRRAGEIGFDMLGGEYTHEADQCTFEVLVSRLGIDDAAVRQLAEVVHDIDLKDGKYGRPEAPGVQQLVQGLVRAHPTDAERLARGLAAFDVLYASFQGGPAPGVRSRGRQRGPSRRRRR